MEVPHVRVARAAAAAERGEKVTGLSTGFVALDTLTTGFHPGELIILAGRPGMGKTALALQFATAAAFFSIVSLVTTRLLAAPLTAKSSAGFSESAAR